MEKFYEVTLYAALTVIVSADDEEQAMEIADSQTGCGDYRFVESDASLIPVEKLDSYKRHADLVIEG